MRHAKSDWSSDAATDFDRPLAKRGRKDAPRMGRWLNKHGLVPDKIISSPARRTRETAVLAAAAMGFPEPDIIWDKQIYDGSLQDLLEVINRYQGDARTFMLIAHNPGLDALLEFLSGDSVTYSDTGKLMTTAAVAVLDFGSQTVTTTASGARLKDLVRPRELDD